MKNATMGAMVRAITGIYTENAIHFSLIFGSNRIVKYVKNREQRQHIDVQFSAEYGKNDESRDYCREEKFFFICRE